ncbi:MAG: hypothetical protein ACYDCK_01475 [Thermoplasmatota archaeon]
MTATYAPAIKNVLTDLQAKLIARATADAITVGEVLIGQRTLDLRSYSSTAILLFWPDDKPTREMQTRSLDQLTLTVLCVSKQLQKDQNATLALGDLVGVVSDTIEANATHQANWSQARVESVRVTQLASGMDPVAYLAEIRVNIDVFRASAT